MGKYCCAYEFPPVFLDAPLSQRDNENEKGEAALFGRQDPVWILGVMGKFGWETLGILFMSTLLFG